MAGRTNAKHSRDAQVRRCGVVIGGAASVFVAAAAIATGSATPAHADFEELIDPIIQPLLTHVVDAVSTLDPAAALDLTSWSDNVLSSLSSLDLALPSVEHAAAAASSATDAASAAASSTDSTTDLASAGTSIPITMVEGTEPTVTSTVDGASTTLLVDTGSSGLVVPDTDLGLSSPLQTLDTLGWPTHIGVSGYSGGVDYIYYTYDEPVDYANGVDTTVPVEVEVYSWEPGNFASLFSNDAFQNFDASNGVTGILGIGDNVSGGAGESPLEAAGYSGVTVDLTKDQLVLGENSDPTGAVELSGSGSTASGLSETVTTSTGASVGSGTISDDLDTGGVYGTIPSSISGSSLAPGDVVTVSDNGQELYSYIVGAGESPTVTSGTSIDSGVEPLLTHPLYIDYTNGDLYLDK